MENKQVSFIYLLGWLWVIITVVVCIYVFVWGASWVGRVVIFAFVPDSYDSLSTGFVKLWGGLWHWAAPIISVIGGIGLATLAGVVMNQVGVAIGIFEPEPSEEYENPS